MAKQIHDQLDDTLPFIFLKLPFKFLLPLRYVSRSWNELISNPKFEEWHLEVGQKPTYKILLSTNNEVQSFDYEASSFEDHSAFTTLNLRFKSPRRNLILLGSCNGLIFCSLQRLSQFFIWNPYTGHYKPLPNPYIPDDDRRTPIGGFGYDACTDDYKAVVATLYKRRNKKLFVCVFSLRRDCWTYKEYSCDFNESDRFRFSTKHQRGLFFNGRLYWMKCDILYLGFFDHSDESDHNSNSDKLEGTEMIVFDLVEERLYTEQFLETIMDGMEELGVLGWNLCVAIRTIEIWELWLLKDSWKLEFKIDIDDDNFFEPLCLTNSGQIILLMDDTQFFRYDPVKNTYKVLKITDHKDTHAVVYFENPISPNTLYKDEDRLRCKK